MYFLPRLAAVCAPDPEDNNNTPCKLIPMKGLVPDKNAGNY